MATTFSMSFPHALGQAEVKQRIDSAVATLSSQVAGRAQATTAWEGDTMHISVSALGQTALAWIEAQAAAVLVTVQLPLLLVPFKGKIQQVVAQAATKML